MKNILKAAIAFAMITLSHGDFFVGGGQSNFEAAEQRMQYMANELGEDICTTSQGGENILQWVSGSSGSYTRSTNYLAHFYAGDGTSEVEQHATANSLALSSIKGFFWGQGETGSSSETVSGDYAERFTAMIGFLKSDWGITGEFPVVVMSIQSESNVATYDDVFNDLLVNQQLQKFVRDYGNADIINTTRFDKNDGVHNSSPVVQILARRYWKTMYRLLPDREVPTIHNRPNIFNHL